MSNPTHSNPSLKIGTINIRGFGLGNSRFDSKLDYITRTLYKESFDILVLTETHLRANDITPPIPNYLWFHNFCPAADHRHLGVSILLRNNLEGLETSPAPNHLQGRALAIRLLWHPEENINSNMSIWIAGLYAPNDYTLKKRFFSRIKRWLPSNSKLIVCGDFNASLSRDSYSSKNFSLDDFCHSTTLSDTKLLANNADGSPTCFSTSGFPSIIDYILVRGASGVTSSSSSQSSLEISDHVLLATTILFEELGPLHRSTNYRPPRVSIDPSNKTKVEQFQTNFQDILAEFPSHFYSSSTLLNREELCSFFPKFTQALANLQSKIFGITGFRDGRNKEIGEHIAILSKVLRSITILRALQVQNQSTFPAQTKEKLERKLSKLLLNLDLHLIPQSDPTLEYELKKLRSFHNNKLNHLRHQLAVKKRAKFASLLQQEGRKGSSLFRRLYYGAPSSKCPSALKEGDSWITDPAKLRDNSADYMEQLGNGTSTSTPPPTSSWTQSNFLSSLQNSAPRQSILLDFQWNEFLHIISKSSPNSSPGPDQIRYGTLKMLPPDGKRLLFNFVHSMINHEIFPEQLLEGEVVLLFKSGSPYSLSNYRTITLLNVIYKIITEFMRLRLSSFVKDKLHWSHGGAIPGRSAHDRVAILLQLLAHCKRHNKPLFLLATDIIKAYDSTPYRGLLDGLVTHGVDNKFCRIYSSLLNSSKIKVRTKAGLSRSVPISRGCKQGCGLSPLVFVLFMDMLVWKLTETTEGISVHTKPNNKFPSTPLDVDNVQIHAICFFDDLNSFSSSEADIEKALTTINSFMQHYGMQISASKSNIAHWAEGNSTNFSINLEELNIPSLLDNAGWLRILGFWINNEESWLLTWDVIKKKCMDRATLIAKGPPLLALRLKLIKTDLDSIFRYYSPVIGTAPNIDNLQRLCYQRALKGCKLGVLSSHFLFGSVQEGGLHLKQWDHIRKSKNTELFMNSLNSTDPLLRKLSLCTTIDLFRSLEIPSFLLPQLHSRKFLRTKVKRLQNFPHFIKSAIDTILQTNLS